MKLMLTLTAAAALSACAMTADQKRALADVSVQQVRELNAAGIDPVKLDADKLALLSAGCALAPAFYPQLADDIVATCLVIQDAAK